MAVRIAALMACLGHMLCLTNSTVEEIWFETVHFCLVTFFAGASSGHDGGGAGSGTPRAPLQSYMCMYIYTHIYIYV